MPLDGRVHFVPGLKETGNVAALERGTGTEATRRPGNESTQRRLHNSRQLYPLVDDKLRMRDLCRRIDVATPEIFAEISYHSMLHRLDDDLQGRDDFVIKPNCGSAGRGVLVGATCSTCRCGLQEPWD